MPALPANVDAAVVELCAIVAAASPAGVDERLRDEIAAVIQRLPGDGINSPYEDVKAFQIAFGNPVGEVPNILTGHEKRRRLEWMREELEELAEAETVVEQVDAVIDLLYFAFGYLVEMGVPPSGAWNAVHAANMTKLRPGGVHTDAMGKVIKPDGWCGPEEAIARYIETLR